MRECFAVHGYLQCFITYRHKKTKNIPAFRTDAMLLFYVSEVASTQISYLSGTDYYTAKVCGANISPPSQFRKSAMLLILIAGR
jgi:hypothetical protein